MLKRWIGLMLCVILAGCGTIKKQWAEFAPDRDSDYLDEQSTPPLAMPEGMSMNKAYLSDPYAVPQGPLPPEGAKPVDVYPPTLKKVKKDDNPPTN